MNDLVMRAFLLGATIIVLSPSLLILIQCLAGWFGTKHRERKLDCNTKLLVIIPAYNEASEIRATCTAIQEKIASDGVDARIVVIADNCTDDTTMLARAAGVEVLERHEPEQRGKGYALAWAMDALGDAWDGLVVLDADAQPAPGFFLTIADEISHGTHAMQAYYSIDGSRNRRSALMQLALSLCNGARPLGRHVLGGSASIAGNGFALSRRCLEDVPFEPSAALAEDLEHGLALVLAGYRVKPLLDARVYGAPAIDDAGALSQRTRWEMGRMHALRRWLPRLLRRHSWASLECALDLLTPPMAIVALFQALALGCALTVGQLSAAYLAVAGPVCSLLSLIIACRLVGLPLRALSALQYVAWYLFWKLGVYMRTKFWRQKTWVRTARPQ